MSSPKVYDPNGTPSKYTTLYIYFYRKACLASVWGQPIRYWIYLKLSQYFERKHEKEILK